MKKIIEKINNKLNNNPKALTAISGAAFVGGALAGYLIVEMVTKKHAKMGSDEKLAYTTKHCMDDIVNQ